MDLSWIPREAEWGPEPHVQMYEHNAVVRTRKEKIERARRGSEQDAPQESDSGRQ